MMLSALSALNRLILISAAIAALAGCTTSTMGRTAYSSSHSETPRLTHEYPCQTFHVKTLNCPAV